MQHSICISWPNSLRIPPPSLSLSLSLSQPLYAGVVSLCEDAEFSISFRDNPLATTPAGIPTLPWNYFKPCAKCFYGRKKIDICKYVQRMVGLYWATVQ